MFAIQNQNKPPLLVLDQVSAAYNQEPVLENVSLSVYENEIVGLSGPNGAGKSTILKVIGGLLKIQSGSITLRGKNVSSLKSNDLQKRGVGFVIQGGHVFPNLTVSQNLELSRRNGLNKSLKSHLGSLDHMIETLKKHMNIRAGLLSGGLRQILAISMIVDQKPSLLLLDEPTAGLSSELAKRFMDWVTVYANLEGHAVVLVEQDTTVIQAISTRFLNVSHGSINTTIVEKKGSNANV